MATPIKKQWLRNVGIIVSDDGMKAQVRITRARGNVLPTYDELVEHLEAYGVLYGLQKDELTAATLPDAEGTKTYLAAKGTSMEPPVRATIQYLKNYDPALALRRGKENADVYDEKQWVLWVSKGEGLARRIPGSYGRSGRTVRGEPLPMPAAKLVDLPTGINTETSKEDPHLLVAAKTGNVVKVGARVNVFEEWVIEGNVDPGTGPIEFHGSLRVKGSILSGMKVAAEGNIVVEGGVEDATVICGGNLIVKGGILGRMRNLISAQGSVVAKFVNGHHLRAMGSIFVREECVNSKVECGDVFEVSEKGVIVGGETYVFKKLDVRILGSESGAYTDIYFGVDTLFLNRIEEIRGEKVGLRETCKKHRKSYYEIVKNAVETRRDLDPAELERLDSVKTKLFSVYARLEKMEQEEEALAERRGAGATADVVVRETAFPGVKLASATTSLFVKEKAMTQRRFFVNGANIAHEPIGA